LIIEDESLMSALMQRYLKSTLPQDFDGSRKRSSTLRILNLESGWELLNSDLSHVRVAIVDILLPQVTGVDLIRDFRRRYPQMGLLPISGMATEPMKRQLRDLLPEGFDLLKKPLRRDDFVESFLKAWNFSSSQQSKIKKPEKQPLGLTAPNDSSGSQELNALEESYWSVGVSQSQDVAVVKRKKIPKKAA
jgi:DNA-binding NtrC family response regulator